MTKRKRGRPSRQFITGPDGEAIDLYQEYADRFRFMLQYIEDRPIAFRRRRGRSGRRVTLAETRREYIERLLPAVQEMCRDLYPYALLDNYTRGIINLCVPPDTHRKGDVNKKGLAYALLLFYHGRSLSHPTLKAVRDRVGKASRGQPSSDAEIEAFWRQYTPDELVDEATRDLPTED